MNISALALDDFIDEDVVDLRGVTIGTLACYWESTSGDLFLGIKVNGEETARVVPGVNARVDDRHSCIQVDFQAGVVQSAPLLDCDEDLKARLEVAAKSHFGVT
jgi:hypothetical protein